MNWIAVLSFLLVVCTAGLETKRTRFPDDFIFAAATASYQIEGAWNQDGKGESIWDYETHHNPHLIKDKSTGDIAADSYHNYKRDVEMCRELGLDMYRFSLSWSRILPTGFANKINQAGITYYNNLIDELLKYNITPMITIFHWDLPQNIQKLGGFANPLFADWFEDYARIVYRSFSDRVKHWVTFNEPLTLCYEGYGADTKAPFLNMSGIADYLCSKHVMVAHGRAYRIYEEEIKPKQGGVCGIAFGICWYGPATDSADDHYAAMISRQYAYGIYAHPIFSKEGGYPKEFYDIVANKSASQGYPRSRLPDFSEEEKKMLKGSSDFFGVNHYTAITVSATDHIGGYAEPSMAADAGVGLYLSDKGQLSASSWFRRIPDSLFNTVKTISDEYDKPVFYITENGWSSQPGLIDNERVFYFREKLNECLDLIDAGVDLRGYMAWSLMDNFEWHNGYTETFGIYEVNFTDPARTRTARKSAYVYKEIVRSRVIDYNYEPDMSKGMSIDEGH